MSDTETVSADETQQNQSVGSVQDDIADRNGQGSQDGGDTILDSEDENGEWQSVQRRKRLRTSTGSATPSMSNSDFDKLSMDQKLSAMFRKFNDMNDTLDDCLSDHKRVNKLESHVGEHDVRITQLEYRTLDLEARSRRNNLIFHGIAESRGENCSTEIANFLKKYLDIETCPPMPRVNRLGRYVRGENRPIIAFCLDTRDSDLIFSKAKALQGTSYSLNRDYPKPIANARKALWPKYKSLREAYPNNKVVMAFPAKIVVDGEVIHDKFPQWNLYLHGDPLQAAKRGNTQGSRAGDDIRPTRSTMADVVRQNNAQSSQHSAAATGNRSPRHRSRHRSRSHRRGQRRAASGSAHRSRGNDGNIRRPWTDDEAAAGLGSQSLLQGR